jgi:hypothetical protein
MYSYIPQGAEEDIRAKWSVVTGNCGKSHNGKLHEISTLSPNIFSADQIKKEMAGVCGTHGGQRGTVHTEFWWENLKKIDHLEEPGVAEKTIFKWMFKK